MLGRKAVIGLSLLSAFLLSAFAAQSVSALVVTKSNNTTAFTCVDVGTEGDFKDAHCDEKDALSNSKYEHQLIPLNTTTEIDLTNEKVANGTTASVPAVLLITIGGVKTTIECSKVKGNVKNSTVHNVEPTSKQHTFTGTIEKQFSGCSVKGLAKCVVAEPIVLTATIHGVEGFKGPKDEANAMGIEFVGHGEKETLGIIEFLNKGAEKCSVNGQKFPITGRMVATNGPTAESKQDNKWSGSTLTFQDKTGAVEMQTLKCGPFEAEFRSILTPTMAGSTTPISLTTTT